MARIFKILIERDAQGYYVASVPELPRCHAQARTLDRLTERIHEAIRSSLESEGDFPANEFIGVQHITRYQADDQLPPSTVV
jgi:predicted RNase H-like HicB family nuclease